MKRNLLMAFVFVILTSSAEAGFQRWSAKVTANPFTGGTDVAALYIISRRSQVQIGCDSNNKGITITGLPGYAYTESAGLFKPTVKIAVDGEVILDNLTGVVGSYGDNIAGVSVSLDKANADILTDALVSARKQIAIQDGMSTKPFLLTARGSTAAAKKIKKCYLAQKGESNAPKTDLEGSKVERITEIKAEIQKLKSELIQLEK